VVSNTIAHSLRMIRRAPLLTSAIVLTIALAIAANTTIFSIVNAVLLRPLPFKDPNRLLQVAEKNDKLNLPNFGASVLNFVSWREQARSFEELAAIAGTTYTLTGTGEPEQLSGSRISPALTRVLGISPIRGRVFIDEEERPGAPPVAMLGEGLWKRRFGAELSVIGRTITLDGAPTTVVGIAPAPLGLIAAGDIYTPLTIDPAKEIRLNHVIFVVGRLKSGVSTEQAQSEMNAISTRLGQQYPEIRDWGIRLITMIDTFVTPELKTGLVVLMCAVGFVLLIACANIANLLLARAAARQSEMAVRTAMGANRGRLVRQLLSESALLSVIGGVVGSLVAVAALHVVNRSLPPNTLPLPAIEMDLTVLSFALGVTILTGLLFGVAPALRTARVDLNDVLKHGGRSSAGNMHAGLRNVLAGVELTLATVLLIGAGLFIQSLLRLEGARLGFDSRGLITFQLAPPVSKYPLNSKAPQLYRAVLDSLQSLPGVKGAAVSSGVPFGNGNFTSHPMVTTEQSTLPPGTAVPIDWRIVSPGYFATMRIPLVRGRDFTDADDAAAQPVMVISEATAKKFWGNADPLGHTLRRSADPRTAFTVVGVVGDVHNTALNQQSPALYYPMASRVWPLMDIVVRTDGPTDALMPSIRQRVHELDAELALANVRTMDEWLSNSAAQPRLNTVLISIFATVALIIAAIGIYGVLAYSVTQRTREIGVRMAMGATPVAVLKLIVREGMTIALIGIAVGVIGGLGLGRTMSSLVFGVGVRDPKTFAAVALALSSIALAACVFPAIRASRIDPMAALRYE
jgi:putative ABC transport system permease protein